MPAEYFLDANILIYTVGNITPKKQDCRRSDRRKRRDFDANDHGIRECHAPEAWL